MLIRGWKDFNYHAKGLIQLLLLLLLTPHAYEQQQLI